MKSRKIAEKNITEKRKKEGVCVRCGEQLHKGNTYCDYCLISKRINSLENTQKRILRIMFGTEKEQVKKGIKDGIVFEND